MTVATAVTATTQDLTEITVSVPADVLRVIDQVAAEMALSRSEMLTAAARRFLFSEQRWRNVQAVFSAAAQESGLREEDIEAYHRSLPRFTPGPSELVARERDRHGLGSLRCERLGLRVHLPDQARDGGS